MAGPANVARSVRLFADRTLSPAALSANLAATAIRTRDALVASGDAPKPWTTYVDGRRGAPEASVRPDGAIVYRFNVLGLCAAFALAFVRARSPVASGAFRKAWAVVLDGKPYAGDLNDIPAAGQIMIVNPLPYARKVEVGGMLMSVPPGIVEAARLATRRQYPTLAIDSIYANIPAGLFAGAPYVLKRQGVDSGLSFSKKTGWSRRHAPKLTRRKDRAAGQPITYPALLISERT